MVLESMKDENTQNLIVPKYTIILLLIGVFTVTTVSLGMGEYINKKLKSQFALPYRDVKKYVCFKEDLKL